MGRKSRMTILFAMALLLLVPGMTAEAKTKPKLAAKKKTITVGQTYRLKFDKKGESGKGSVVYQYISRTEVHLQQPIVCNFEIACPFSAYFPVPYFLFCARHPKAVFTKKGDCSASRYALQYMCNHMGIKAAACGNLDAHGKTLVYAEDKFYVVITGFNEPKPRHYEIYEISGASLEELAKQNNFDLDYFRQ